MQLDEILNKIIQQFSYTSYLEIGTDWGHTFNKINCARKVGVEPRLGIVEPGGKIEHGNVVVHKLVSDEYFYKHNETFDLIFIDGMHEYHQALRDIINALLKLNDGGLVTVHDTYPKDEIQAMHAVKFWNGLMRANPDYTGGWVGDTWKAIAWLKRYSNNLDIVTLDIEYGLTIIKPHVYFVIDELGYNDFKVHKNEILNITDSDSLMQWIETARHVRSVRERVV